MSTENSCCQNTGDRTMETVNEKNLPAGSFKEYRQIWVGGMASPLNIWELWEMYNSNSVLAQKVDSMFEAQMAKYGYKFFRSVLPYKKLKVWVTETGQRNNEALAVGWEIRQCSYCGKDEACMGHVVDYGIYAPACESCNENRRQELRADPDGSKRRKLEKRMESMEETEAELDSDHARDMGVT